MEQSRFYVLASRDGVPVLINVPEFAAANCFHPDANQDVMWLNDSGELEPVLSDYVGHSFDESDDTVTSYINLVRSNGQVIGKGSHTEL